MNKPQPRPVGRPPKLTETTVKKIEEGAALGCTDTEIALKAGISRTTFYEWIKNDPALADRLDELREKPFLKARQTIVDSLDNPKDAQWYMERKKKGEFALRTELTGAEGEQLGTVVLPIKEIRMGDNEDTLEAST